MSLPEIIWRSLLVPEEHARYSHLRLPPLADFNVKLTIEQRLKLMKCMSILQREVLRAEASPKFQFSDNYWFMIKYLSGMTYFMENN